MAKKERTAFEALSNEPRDIIEQQSKRNDNLFTAYQELRAKNEALRAQYDALRSSHDHLSAENDALRAKLLGT